MKFDHDYGEKVKGPEDQDLYAQHRRVYDAMRDGQWRSLARVVQMTGDPATSVAARLRDLRKERFGAYTVQAKRFPGQGWKYRLGAKGTHQPRHYVKQWL